MLGSYFKDMQYTFAASIQGKGVVAKASLIAAQVQGRPDSPQENLSVGMDPVYQPRSPSFFQIRG